ncbi:MAG TPA: MFS transporter [Actinomycetales bacterium]|nr:MFS transporter [Actinomycetales bacterium]
MTTRTRRPARPGLTLAAVLLALATVVSAVASLNVAIPDIARSTGASNTQIAWVIDAYALSFAALLLPGGALGDRIGRRRVLIGGLVLYGVVAGSVIVLDQPAHLIVVRALLGVGAAVVMPATLSTITATFPPERRVDAVALWAGVAGASAILGLLTSGIVLELWSWRSVFLLSTVLALAALVGVVLAVPESADPEAASKDPLGVVLSVLGLTVVVYSLIEAPTHGWSAVRTWGGLLAGVGVLALFAAWETRAARPLLAPRYFRHTPFLAGSISLTAQFFAFFGFIFLTLQYLQIVRGDSALVAALSMLPLPLGLMPAVRLAPRLMARFGQARLVGLGLTLAAAALWVLAGADVETPYLAFGVALWVLALGMGLAMPPATTAITDALPRAEQGVASAMNDLARELGGALGIAVMSSVATQTYREALVLPTQVPASIAHAAESSFSVGAQLAEPIGGLARAAFTAGMQDALRVASFAVLVAAVVVTALLLRSARGTRELADEERRVRDARV